MTDKPAVLRKGDAWKLSDQNKQATERFGKLAKEYGSAARWLSETGYLVTEDPKEAAKSFPYEEWRDQALKETDQI